MAQREVGKEPKEYPLQTGDWSVLVRRIERRRRVDSIGDDGLLRGRASITHCVVERTLDFESLTVQFSGTVGMQGIPRPARYVTLTLR